MTILVEPALVALMLTALALLGTSRIRTCIALVAAQGLLLGVLPIAVYGGPITLDHMAMAAGAFVARGVVFPYLLLRTSRRSLRGSVDSAIPYAVATLIGVLIMGYCMWLGARLHLSLKPMTPLVIPVGLSLVLIGLLLVIVRRSVISQVIAYLVLENGIHALGVGLQVEEEILVQLGVMLDLFVALFIMGIAIYHIKSEFDHNDADGLSALRD